MSRSTKLKVLSYLIRDLGPRTVLRTVARQHIAQSTELNDATIKDDLLHAMTMVAEGELFARKVAYDLEVWGCKLEGPI